MEISNKIDFDQLAPSPRAYLLKNVTRFKIDFALAGNKYIRDVMTSFLQFQVADECNRFVR